MASKRGVRRREQRRSCERKVAHATLQNAQRAKSKTQDKNGTGLHLMPYKCKFCSFFHIGHMPARIRHAQMHGAR